MTQKVNKPILRESLAAYVRKEEQRAEAAAALVLFAFSCLFFGPLVIAKILPWYCLGYLPIVAWRWALAKQTQLHENHIAFYSVINPTIVLAPLIYCQFFNSAALTFSLKSTVYGALFVTIAIRAIAHKQRYVWITGITAALGWMGFALYQDPSGLVVESAKALLLMTATGATALAATRSRELVTRAASGAKLNQQFSRFFSSDTVEKIKASAGKLSPGYGESRQAAILMMDLRGFTKLSENLPAPEVVSILSEYQSRMVDRLFENNGSIDKFMGDGILAHFGAANDSETYAADCIRAALAMVEEARLWNQERASQGKPVLNFGLSCALGKVVFGVVGDHTRMEFTTIGEAVNFAAKLEKHTKELRVTALATNLLLEKAKEQGVILKTVPRLIPNASVAGADKPVDLVVLAESLADSQPKAA